MSHSIASDGAKTGLSALAGKYLTFKLAAEEYGVQILKVQEIIKMMTITKVPRTPDFIQGVINLRGKVIPIIDLRLKFAMPHQDLTDKTCIIVVQVPAPGTSITMGLIVDEVSEVLDIPAADIEPTPSFGASVDTRFMLGMAKMKDGVKILLDIDRVLSPADVDVVAGTARSHPAAPA